LHPTRWFLALDLTDELRRYCTSEIHLAFLAGKVARALEATALLTRAACERRVPSSVAALAALFGGPEKVEVRE